MTLSKFLQQLDQKYGKINPIDFAKNLLKENADVGTAVVSVLSSTGIAGFKFHIPQSEQVKMESEITDHYTDRNSAVQDHIARRPVTITVSGLQGEYFYSVNQIEDTLALVVPTMKLCKQLMPRLDAATIQGKLAWQNYQKSMDTAAAKGYIGILPNLSALNITSGSAANISQDILKETKGGWSKAKEGWQTLNGVDMFKLFQDVYKLKSAQTRAFLYLQAMWLSSTPFTVETTWRRYDNMLIQSLVPVRDNNTDITEFTVTFKQVNFTESKYTDLENVAKLTRQQLMEKVNKGVNKGQEVKAV